MSHEVLQRCRHDPVFFHKHFLKPINSQEYFWAKQVEIARSFVENRTTLVCTGNGIGKSWVAARLKLWASCCHPGSLLVSTAPSQQLVENVLWKQSRRAHKNAPVPLGGRYTHRPEKLDFGDGWMALGFSSDSIERLSGQHEGDLFVIVDEGSGIEEEVWEGLDSLNASRTLILGNPIRQSGRFYELAHQTDNPTVNLIHVASTDGPHCHLERSPWGLADKAWLDAMRYSWGEDSPWWRVHVQGLFPEHDDNALIPPNWLVASNHPGRKGRIKIAVDLAKGSGGTSDNSVILVVDDAGILDLHWNNTWGPQETAQKVKEAAISWGVEPANIVYDATGIGMDFGNRLEYQGLKGCKQYVGTNKLRSDCAWAMRLRLDPGRTLFPQPDMRLQPKASLGHLFGAMQQPYRITPEPEVQQRFAIRQDWLERLRPELQGLRYKLGTDGGIALEPKAELAKRIGHSPDLADALLISFSI